jgi:hypothetical protein
MGGEIKFSERVETKFGAEILISAERRRRAHSIFDGRHRKVGALIRNKNLYIFRGLGSLGMAHDVTE